MSPICHQKHFCYLCAMCIILFLYRFKIVSTVLVKCVILYSRILHWPPPLHQLNYMYNRHYWFALSFFFFFFTCNYNFLVVLGDLLYLYIIFIFLFVWDLLVVVQALSKAIDISKYSSRIIISTNYDLSEPFGFFDPSYTFKSR